jgi:uroporphyrinogen decarboxylase
MIPVRAWRHYRRFGYKFIDPANDIPGLRVYLDHIAHQEPTVILDLQALDRYRLTDRPVDYRRLERALRRQEPVADGVPLFELFSNLTQEAVSALQCPPYILTKGVTLPEPLLGDYAKHITSQYVLGYDHFAIVAHGFGFDRKKAPSVQTAQGNRSFVQGSLATIATRAEFEQYVWPDPAKVDYDFLSRMLTQITPPGMKAIAANTGMLENVMWLMSYEGISMALYDDPQLVQDMFDAVGSRILEVFTRLMDHPNVLAIQMGEDMGHKTQTMLAPDVYRKYLFPWHRKLVDAVHARGKLAILHSCGHLDDIMEDILACGWDAKHSFEDSIIPAWEFKRRYGDRIAVLGGFDIDKLCRMTPDQVREHTRMMIERCTSPGGGASGGGGGGWAMGSGNSIANYIPLENYLAMLKETLAYNCNAATVH